MRAPTQAFAVMVCDHDRRRSDPTTIVVTELVSTLDQAQAAAVRLNAARPRCDVFYFVRSVRASQHD